MDATVPFSYITGFIINCGYRPEEVVSFEVKWDRIIWMVKVKEGSSMVGIRKVEQLIVREPPPVKGGSNILLDVTEQMGVATTMSTEESNA